VVAAQEACQRRKALIKRQVESVKEVEGLAKLLEQSQNQVMFEKHLQMKKDLEVLEKKVHLTTKTLSEELRTFKLTKQQEVQRLVDAFVEL
jgi:hypothetical protein